MRERLPRCGVRLKLWGGQSWPVFSESNERKQTEKAA